MLLYDHSKTVHASLTRTGSINVVEFSAILVGSLITLVKLKSDRQSLNCIFVKLIKSIFMSPVSITNGI